MRVASTGDETPLNASQSRASSPSLPPFCLPHLNSSACFGRVLGRRTTRPLTSGLQSAYQTVAARGEHGCNNRGAGRDTMASHTCPMNSTTCRPCCSALSSPDVSLPFGSLAHSLMRIRRPRLSSHNSFLCSFLTMSLNKSYFYLSIVVGSSSQHPCLAVPLFSPACDQAAPEIDKRNCKGLCARKAKETKRMISGIPP